MPYIMGMVDSQKNLSRSLLSVVIPVYNEEESIEACIKKVTQVLISAEVDHEIVIVNDGSSDQTLQICLEIKRDIPIRILNLSRNSGHMAAITAGLEAAKGDFVATMDADLQDPPVDLLMMYEIISRNSTIRDLNQIDVVQAFRIDRSVDSFLKRLTAAMYYRIIEKITGLRLIHHAADFRIMTREVVDALVSLPERNRIYRLLIPKLGFSVTPYPIVRAKRFAGKTKYSLNKMVKLSIDSVFAFSYKPLRFFSYLGLISSFILFLAALITLMISLMFETVPGWPSLALLLLSANSFLFAGLGLLGEYVGRTYELVQARPIANWNELE